jgi:hypothetical protein
MLDTARGLLIWIPAFSAWTVTNALYVNLQNTAAAKGTVVLDQSRAFFERFYSNYPPNLYLLFLL